MFHDPSRFSFTAVLEAHAAAILAEFHGVRDEMASWPETKLHDRGWNVYGLYDFPHGQALEAQARRCPRTSALIARHVPGHGAAGFSLLKPRCRIRPHTGYHGPYLRCHLGLVVPDGDCGLRVAREVRRWAFGQTMVFDDRVEHEAWNLTDEPRVVLLIDFVPDASRS